MPLSTKYFLTKDAGQLKKGIYSDVEINQHFGPGSKPPIIPLSWALRDGLMQADVSEAAHIDSLTFYSPEEMETKRSAEQKNKKKFLFNQLGELIRAKNT